MKIYILRGRLAFPIRWGYTSYRAAIITLKMFNYLAGITHGNERELVSTNLESYQCRLSLVSHFTTSNTTKHEKKTYYQNNNYK